jgi:hypothetical protein
MTVIINKVDENLPIEVARRLNDAGHDALSVLDQKRGGASDEAIAGLRRSKPVLPSSIRMKPRYN